MLVNCPAYFRTKMRSGKKWQVGVAGIRKGGLNYEQNTGGNGRQKGKANHWGQEREEIFIFPLLTWTPPQKCSRGISGFLPLQWICRDKVHWANAKLHNSKRQGESFPSPHRFMGGCHNESRYEVLIAALMNCVHCRPVLIHHAPSLGDITPFLLRFFSG